MADRLHEFENIMPTLSRGEKAQLLKRVLQDLGDVSADHGRSDMSITASLGGYRNLA